MTSQSFPFDRHPCWAQNRQNIVARIHLPVAPKCNVRCIYCDPTMNTSCHISKPGQSSKVMSVNEAVTRTIQLMDDNRNIGFVGISGPGEPLYNDATFESLRIIRELFPEIDFCLSTNGLLLESTLSELLELRIRTISVSMSAISPMTSWLIYKWIDYHGTHFSGSEIGDKMVSRQLKGIRAASEAGIHVKINTILMKGINDTELEQLAYSLKIAGAELQNIIPLVPCFSELNRFQPSNLDLRTARLNCSRYIQQFHHCAMCRSDVVGIPGDDRII